MRQLPTISRNCLYSTAPNWECQEKFSGGIYDTSKRI